jgi:hypothetical protein
MYLRANVQQLIVHYDQFYLEPFVGFDAMQASGRRSFHRKYINCRSAASACADLKKALGGRPSQQDQYAIVSPEEFPGKSSDQQAIFAVYDGQ